MASTGLLESDKINLKWYYLAAPNVVAELREKREPACTIRELRLIVLASGNYHLMPFRPPNEDGYLDDWAMSALEAWEVALTSWVRLTANLQVGRYDCIVAEGDLGEPEWPGKTLAEMLTIAFKGRVIENMSHPVLRRLRGEIR